jgi:hypothetical protein
MTAKLGNRKPDYKANNEYYTPSWVFEKLGLEFDLDVCAPVGGVEWIPAKNHYSLENDGLTNEWNGLVWCNPPYSNPTPWIDKFLAHGNGIMLTQVSRSNAFMRLWSEGEAIMFLPRNMTFEHKEHGTKSIFMPVALFGMGHKAHAAFIRSGIARVR